MTPAERGQERRSGVLEIGVLAALFGAFSALMALVSLALYRVERDEMGENGGVSNAGPPFDSGDGRS